MICLVSIISGVLMSLLPKNKLDNAFKGLVSLIIISCLILPLDGKKISVSYKDFIHKPENEGEMFIDSSDVVVDCAENMLKEQLDSALAEINPSAYCEVYIAYSDESAYIEKIEIYVCGDEAEKERISAVIREKTGGDTVIEFR